MYNLLSTHLYETELKECCTKQIALLLMKKHPSQRRMYIDSRLALILYV